MRVNVLDKGFVELVDIMGDDNAIVSAARVSHLGKSKGAEKDAGLIKYLLEHQHTSPFEQVEFKFRVKCPIFIARQWMRHRTWNFNEVSRRYTSVDIDFHIPEHFRQQSEENHQGSIDQYIKNEKELLEDLEKFSWLSLAMYSYYLDCGVCKEQARMLLPVNLYTMFYAKVDLHNLLHFLNVRNHPDAQYEMVLYANALEKFVKYVVPVTYSIWKGMKNEQ